MFLFLLSYFVGGIRMICGGTVLIGERVYPLLKMFRNMQNTII